MKKKIFGGLLVLAIAAVAAFNLNLNSEDSGFSLLSLVNVEALAGDDENTGKLDTSYDRATKDCTISANAAIAMGLKVKGSGDVTMTDAEVVCSGGGNTACTPINCSEVWANLLKK